MHLCLLAVIVPLLPSLQMHLGEDMWLLAQGVWLLVHDMWLLARGVWLLVHDMWSLARGVWLLVYMTCGHWHELCGYWYTICDHWHTVCDDLYTACLQCHSTFQQTVLIRNFIYLYYLT